MAWWAALASLEPVRHADGEQAKRDEDSHPPRRRASARLARAFLHVALHAGLCVPPAVGEAAVSRAQPRSAGLGPDAECLRAAVARLVSRLMSAC